MTSTAVIEVLVDDGYFFEIKAEYAKSLVDRVLPV